MIKFFKDTQLLENVKDKINPLILISLVKLNYHDYPFSKKNAEKINIYKNLFLKNITPNFFKKFKLGTKQQQQHSFEYYEDVHIWESQFGSGNVILLLKEEKECCSSSSSECPYYLMHISFLTQFHNDLIKYELSNYENLNILNHVQKFTKIEKDILKRNSGRELFQFCCENSLNCCEYVEDVKAKELKNKEKPYLAKFCHYEFLNDFYIMPRGGINENKICYLENCSIFNKILHLKIYTFEKVHLITFEKEDEEKEKKEMCLFKNLSGDNKLNQIYGKTFQNYKKLVEVFPDNEIIKILSNEKEKRERKKRKKRKKRLILSTEQIYTYE